MRDALRCVVSESTRWQSLQLVGSRRDSPRIAKRSAGGNYALRLKQVFLAASACVCICPQKISISTDQKLL